jgi:hypothetical protein
MEIYIDSSRYGMLLGREVDLANERVAEAEARVEAASNPVSRFIGDRALKRSVKSRDSIQGVYEKHFAVPDSQATINNETAGGEA